MLRLLLAILLLANTRTDRTAFSPNTKDYDAYGIIIAGNEIMLVESQGDQTTFLVQYAPYNYTLNSLQCIIEYDDPRHYVYSVGIGVKQNSTQSYFIFAGEVGSSSGSSMDQKGNNCTFIGIMSNHDPVSPQTHAATNQWIPCNQFQTEHLKFSSSYDHQEFFVLAVDPYGQYALGFAKDFVFTHHPFSLNVITRMNSSSVWPNGITFMPHAADADISYTIVAGYVGRNSNARSDAKPTIYLISNTNLTILSTWSYSATNGSWQARLTYSNVESGEKKYAMSVDINSANPTRVLVGIPILNTVFVFSIDNNGTKLTLVSSLDNGIQLALVRVSPGYQYYKWLF